MTLRPGSLRSRRRAEAAPQDAPEPAVEVSWDDLTEAERTALKRLNRGFYPGLSQELGERLTGLGLAVARPDGIGISRAGRELVIDTLLKARLDDTNP
ncbi:MAG: hypothetical protein J0H34_06805 [Rhizobiales bacterium]|nr:hypothetical protein [Hyphomicrobiales bacterium]